MHSLRLGLAKLLVREQLRKELSERAGPPEYLHVGVAVRGNHLTSACCQQLPLLQSQLASEISPLDVLDLYLKLSGLEGQGQ